MILINLKLNLKKFINKEKKQVGVKKLVQKKKLNYAKKSIDKEKALIHLI